MLGWWAITATALADQCAWIPDTTAAAAVRFLTPGSPYALFCEPCGDKAPVVRTVAAAPVVAATSDPALVEVSVDGQPLDLAYVFVPLKPGAPSWRNLSRLARCPATGVSKAIPARAAQ